MGRIILTSRCTVDLDMMKMYLDISR